MTDQEYKDFVAQENSGALLIGIDCAIARKFYTDIPLSKIKDETGATPYFEKIVIWSAFLMAPCALLVSFILAVLAFHWWSALAIPLSVVVYFFFSGQSSMPRRGAIALDLSQRKLNVFIVARDEGRARATAKEIEEKTGTVLHILSVIWNVKG